MLNLTGTRRFSLLISVVAASSHILFPEYIDPIARRRSPEIYPTNPLVDLKFYLIN